MGFINYIIASKDQIFSLLLQHIQLTAIAMGLALVIGVPLGILVSYVKKLNKPILGLANVVQAIPSMALLGFAIPFLGIGELPAITMVVLYSLLPIVKNTFTGIDNIDPQMIEAARGIGLTKAQILGKVQIPLALPVIMAGVRISAVTAVGLMTMAAFIGAGGLGYLVFSGIRTVNNYQILAGAIPACILALLVDYLMGLVEKLVTPISLQKKSAKASTKANVIKTRRHQKIILAVSAAVIAVVIVITGINGAEKRNKTISIASKDYTEQMIVANLAADLIEAKTDLTVNRQINMGGTQVCFSALKSNQVDMYVEYTGTAYGDTLKYPPISDVEEVYQTVKKDFKEQFNIEVLKQMSFNNTYTLAVKPELAQQYNLKTFSDLAKISPNLVSGTTLEFLNRADGMPGLMETYNMKFRNTIGIDSSPRYIALENGEVDVIDAFATDGLLKKYELVVLEDDQHFFPPYYAVPIVRAEILEQYPEIEAIMDELGSILTNDVMSTLNYQVDELQKEPEDVAHDFLVEQGMI